MKGAAARKAKKAAEVDVTATTFSTKSRLRTSSGNAPNRPRTELRRPVSTAVSGRLSRAMTSTTAPAAVRNQKTARQPAAVTICPPSHGASIGATTMTMVTLAIRLADSSRPAVSRMMARDSAKVAPEPAPWSTRASSRISTEGAIAPITEPSPNMAVPPITQGRRPNLSESGPTTICVSATAIRNSVSVSWIVA